MMKTLIIGDRTGQVRGTGQRPLSPGEERAAWSISDACECMSERALTASSGPVPTALPSAELRTASHATLEVFAIAAAVFALVLSLLLLYVPTEPIWLLVFALAATRRRLLESGLDLVFASRPSSRCNRRSHEVTRGRYAS